MDTTHPASDDITTKFEDSESSWNLRQSQNTSGNGLSMRPDDGVLPREQTRRRQNAGSRRSPALVGPSSSVQPGILLDNPALSTSAAPAEISITATTGGSEAVVLADSVRQVRSLRSAHELISQQIEEAQDRIYKDELYRGQMIQQYLQLGRDIKQKEIEIGQNKTRLEDLRRSKNKAGAELSTLMTQVELNKSAHHVTGDTFTNWSFYVVPPLGKTPTMTNLSKVVRLEVERKFAAFRNWPLDLQSGSPQFLSLKYLGQQVLCDRYYDSRDLLSEHGIWLRNRNGEWQMKIRKGGDRQNSQFQEISDHQVIAKRIQSLTSKKSIASDNFGLVLLADISATRHSWKADRDFTIVLDQTDFGHTVGEVELEAEVNVSDEHQAETVMREMDSEIARFLARYKWAFSDAPPMGKLSAYLAWKSKEKVKDDTS